MRLHLSIFFLLFLNILPGVNYGQVSFSANADARQIVLGNSVRVEFSLKNAQLDEFRAPSFRDWEVVGGPSHSTQMSNVNGKVSSTIAKVYVLQPKRVGKLTINPASAKVDGKLYQTKAITIEVVKGKNSNAQTQQGLNAELGNDVYVRMVLSKSAGVIGQQILLDYKIYTKRNLEGYNFSSESEYADFYAENLQQFNSRVIREVVDGEQYSTMVIKRVALFPQRAGILEIEPAKITVGIVTGQRKRGFFSMPNLQRLMLTTPPVKLDIKDIPDDPPMDFARAVGQYDMKVNSGTTKLSTDDVLSFQMVVDGNGDGRRFKAPTFSSSDSLEYYEPRIIEERSFERGGQIMHRKVVEYLALPKRKGIFQINPSLSYFDSDSLKFVQLKSTPIVYQVSQGIRKSVAAGPKNRNASKDIQYIHSEERLGKAPTFYVGSPLYWILMALPLVFLGGAYFRWKKQLSEANLDPSIKRKRAAELLAKQKLGEAKTALDNQNNRKFYDFLSKGLFGYCSDKLGVPTADLSPNGLARHLEVKGISENSRTRLVDILHSCERAIFAGMDNPSTRSSLYDQAVQLITEIEKETEG